MNEVASIIAVLQVSSKLVTASLGPLSSVLNRAFEIDCVFLREEASYLHPRAFTSDPFYDLRERFTLTFVSLEMLIGLFIE
jgi:hypothetical protein